jgi:hypothetical protein
VFTTDAPSPPATDSAPPPPPKKRKRRLWLKIPLYLFLALVVALICTRPFMPRAVRWYVNRTLDRAEIYQGKIGDIDLHLWRGAYSIKDVRIVKMTGNVPVPLFAAERVDFAIEWNNLMHRKIVGQFVMEKPELNFVAAADDTQSQSGAGGPWLQIIRDLFPFDINSARVREGSIHFRTYQVPTPVDVYMSHLNASVENLTNIKRESTPLLTTIDATAMAMDQAQFEYHMKLNPFSYRPSFHMTTRLLGLDVTKINDLALAYGNFDFKRGYFDLVVEVDAKHGAMAGYVKPLFRDLKVFSFKHALKDDDPLQFFWTALVGGVTKILTNPPRDQFGTLIPFTADDTTGNSPDLLATLGNLLRNAFVRAYLPKLQGGTPADETFGMHFEPPQISDPVTAGDSSH